MRVRVINPADRKHKPIPPFTGCKHGAFHNIPPIPMVLSLAGGALATCLVIDYLIMLIRRWGK